MQVINTNVTSLTAQRNLNGSQATLNAAMQRLSSGLRINSAKDDAAGLAISQRFTSQIKGMDQAARNANDGISLAQTAEGALGEVTNNLQRMRELAVQSANATNSASDRAALQSEVSQLKSEIDRVASQTQFNGINVLDGTFSNQQFQVGANAGQTITVSSIASARTADLGKGYSAEVTGTAVTAALASGDLTINGKAVAATGADAKAIAASINAVSGTGVTAKANSLTVAGTTMVAAANASNTVTINGVTSANFATVGTAATDLATVIQSVNDMSASTGVVAVENGGVVDLVAADGRNVTVAYGGSATAATTGLAAAGTSRSTLTLSTTGDDGIVIGGASAADAGLTAGTTASQLTGTAISMLDISSVDGANTAIKSIDAALDQINSSRADLGATQNRFTSVVNNLQTTSENLTASRSRIQDADFAQETANLSRSQVLQQAGMSMLSQANSSSQGVLALLRG
jgi:flagellin